MENNPEYSSWETDKVILYDSPLSSLIVRKKQQIKVVEKKIVITEQNKKYTELETSIMREIDSDHVVRYLHHKHKPEEKALYLYMQYYPKGDLEDFLLKNPKIDFRKRLKMLIDILVGLMELHSRFIIHRDLKLKNIFVDDQDNCVVGDLGIATVTEKSAISRLGTVGHQAP